MLQIEAVACKDWLTNKVDRSVTGKVALQQTAGSIQLPLNNLGVMALDYQGKKVDELAVLQRLRHVLFMASSSLHGRIKDLECEFRIHRVPNNQMARHPEATTLKLEDKPSQVESAEGCTSIVTGT